MGLARSSPKIIESFYTWISKCKRTLYTTEILRKCISVEELHYDIIVIFIIKCFRTIAFIFIVISTTFRPICPPAFFRCLSNSGTFTEHRTTSFIESTGITCSDSVFHNWVQVLSIPVLLHACSQDWTCNLQMIGFRVNFWDL